MNAVRPANIPEQAARVEGIARGQLKATPYRIDRCADGGSMVQRNDEGYGPRDRGASQADRSGQVVFLARNGPNGSDTAVTVGSACYLFKKSAAPELPAQEGRLVSAARDGEAGRQ